MKLRYIGTPTDLGGSAVPGCGTIYKSEIKPTLTKLSDDLEMPFDFNDFVVGSTGKREYSGDIDVVVDNKWWQKNDGGIVKFRQMLEEVYGKENVAKNGDIVHLKFPIENYNGTYQQSLPRTGFVQIDFNFGDYEWEKFYHYVDGNSGYKGAHRNLMISAICSVNSYTDFDNMPGEWMNGHFIPCLNDSYNRPTSIIRWKFGPNGFTEVSRVSAKSRDGNWMKKQVDTVLAGPYKDSHLIRLELFEYSSKLEDLDSLETLMAAVKRNYGMTDQERIWKRAASNFADWPQGKLFEYPPEIAAYFLPNDK
jgi:hypothetical protein